MDLIPITVGVLVSAVVLVLFLLLGIIRPGKESNQAPVLEEPQKQVAQKNKSLAAAVLLFAIGGFCQCQRERIEKQPEKQTTSEQYSQPQQTSQERYLREDQGRVPAVQAKERRYRDSHGAIANEREVEQQLSELRRNIRAMPDNAERAYLTGFLRALEDEWARMKHQGPVED
jgi:cytochrome c-type biogenesis protein CcmH/NrfG